MGLSIVLSLNQSAHKISLDRRTATAILLQNDAINIVLQNLSKSIEAAASFAMFAGFVLSVSFNFITIRMYDIIPMPIYLVFPFASGIILMIIQLKMPMLTGIYEGGQEVALKWKYYTQYSKDVKYLTRMIRARQSARVNAGLFGYRIFLL